MSNAQKYSGPVLLKDFQNQSVKGILVTMIAKSEKMKTKMFYSP